MRFCGDRCRLAYLRVNPSNLRSMLLRLMLASLLVGVALGAKGAAAQRTSGTDVQAALRDSIRAVLDGHPEATVAVALRDPQTDVRLDLNADRPFHAASTMKVPVMMEVFRQAEAGRFALGDSLRVENAFRSIVDGSPYRIEDDSDDAIYERLGGAMAIEDLVYQMITVSSNLATNLLIGHVSADSVQKTIEGLGTDAMRVLRGVEDIKAYRQGPLQHRHRRRPRPAPGGDHAGTGRLTPGRFSHDRGPARPALQHDDPRRPPR